MLLAGHSLFVYSVPELGTFKSSRGSWKKKKIDGFASLWLRNFQF